MIQKEQKYSRISASQLIPENLHLYDIENSNHLLQVEVDPIDYCNHNCSWCFTSDFRKDKKINIFNLNNYLIDFCKSGGKSIVFSGGGEPLLYKELYNPSKLFEGKSICSYLIEQGVYIGIITNGFLIDKLIDSDFDLTKLSFVRISLDATNKQLHSKLHETKEADFNRIIKNIKSLNEIRGEDYTPAIGISFVVDPSNNINFEQKTIKSICSLAKELKVDFVQFKHIHTFDSDFAIKNMAIVHSRCLEFDWEEVEFWVQNYNFAKKGKICSITKYIQSVGNNSKKFPCCHHFGREEFLDQSNFLPEGKVIDNCDSKVCRYNEMNDLLHKSELMTIEKDKKKLLKSIEEHGFHPYRYCPTAPEILKPFKTILPK